MPTLEDEATARAINAEPWEPYPGMFKLRCGRCRYWFAAHVPDAPHCEDCLLILRRRLHRRSTAGRRHKIDYVNGSEVSTKSRRSAGERRKSRPRGD